MPTPLKVLLVEDSEDDGILVTHVLRQQGYVPDASRVQTAEELEAALASDRWDVVLADYALPGFSGLDALRQFRRTGLDTPFIVVSGAVGEEMAANLMREGARDFVRKGNMARLGQAIARELKEVEDRRSRQQAEVARAQSEERERAAIAQVRVAMELDRLKTQFVNAISHELRTPLTTILGYAELIEDGAGDRLPEAERGYLAQIHASTRRMDRLVNDLLDYARLDAGTFRLAIHQSEFREIVREAVEGLLPQAAAMAVRLVLELPDEQLPVQLDAQRIEQVISNLVANAIKFSPPGKTVRIRVEPMLYERVQCEVLDEGAGITDEELPRLFQLFSQADEGVRKGGTGLGLAIAKSLVEAHGGEIGVESKPDVGSRFWFWVPRVAHPRPVGLRHGSSAGQDAAGQPRSSP